MLIVDTAGRLAIDAELMTEVARISDAVEPHYTFLVVDSMVGQDAVSTAEAFHATLEVDGIILTKLDGDARGGAALSVAEVVGRPVAFASVGEKIDDFEQFHPDRMASRILGMGDVLTLIEKAEQVYEEAEAEAAAQRLAEGTFTLDDFVDQLRQLRKMGNLQSIVQMMPGISDQVPRCRDRRRPDHYRRGDRAVDDAGRASVAGDHRCVPPSSHRRGKRHIVGTGRQPAQAVRPDAQDDGRDDGAGLQATARGPQGGSQARPGRGPHWRRRTVSPKGSGPKAGTKPLSDAIDWDALDLKLPGR